MLIFFHPFILPFLALLCYHCSLHCRSLGFHQQQCPQTTGGLTQISSTWYLCARKSPYTLHPVSQTFPQRCLWNGSNVRLIDDGFLSAFQGRSSSASSFHASLLQAIWSMLETIGNVYTHTSSQTTFAYLSSALVSYTDFFFFFFFSPFIHPDQDILVEMYPCFCSPVMSFFGEYVFSFLFSCWLPFITHLLAVVYYS